MVGESHELRLDVLVGNSADAHEKIRDQSEIFPLKILVGCLDGIRKFSWLLFSGG